MNDLSTRIRIFAVLLTVQLFYGLHYIAAKWMLEELPAGPWATMRAGGGAVVLVVICLAMRQSLRVERTDLFRLAGLSLFGVTLNQTLFVEGLSRTTATHSSLINAGIPALTLLIAVLLRREQITGRKLLALAIATAGVLLVILAPGSGVQADNVLLGDLLTLMNGTSFALFLVLSKRMLARVDPLVASTWLLIFGSAFIALYGGPGLVDALPLDWSTETWAIAIAIMIFPTAMVYPMAYWALKKVESSSVALFIYVQPIIAGTLSVLFYGETLGMRIVIGGALIFFGVFLTLGGNRQPGQQLGADR